MNWSSVGRSKHGVQSRRSTDQLNRSCDRPLFLLNIQKEWYKCVCHSSLPFSRSGSRSMHSIPPGMYRMDLKSSARVRTKSFSFVHSCALAPYQSLEKSRLHSRADEEKKNLVGFWQGTTDTSTLPRVRSRICHLSAATCPLTCLTPVPTRHFK